MQLVNSQVFVRQLSALIAPRTTYHAHVVRVREVCPLHLAEAAAAPP